MLCSTFTGPTTVQLAIRERRSLSFNFPVRLGTGLPQQSRYEQNTSAPAHRVRSPSTTPFGPTEQNLSGLIWSVADLLRGDYKQSEHGKVILPFTVLRRLDCVLEPTKAAVLAEKKKKSPAPILLKKSGQLFFNTDEHDLKKLMGDQDNLAENLRAYVQGFSESVRDIFERFEFDTQTERLSKAKLLYLVPEKFANIDLHPEKVTNAQMGFVFDELIRRFAELSNETAGPQLQDKGSLRRRYTFGPVTPPSSATNPMRRKAPGFC